MRFYLTVFFLQFFFTSCQSGSNKPEETKATVAPAATPVVTYQMKPDTIEVRGKFLTGCTVPANIRIALHNVDNTFWKDVPVSKTGEFSYKHFLTEPRRAALRTLYGVKFDFFTTTAEKVYEIEITCDKGAETFAIKGSAENDAYQPFSAANKKFQTDLDSLAKNNLAEKKSFALLKQTVSEYQKTMKDIAAKYPNTFTGKVFCPMETLPKRSLASIEALRKNFLQREAYSTPLVYNDFLPQRILLNYISIREKNAGADAAVATLMNIGLKNPEAAKRLQDMMSSIFYKMHQEDLVLAFIKWADANPDKMYNQSVKARLLQLKAVVAGSNMIDFQLNDPAGKPRKFSETVNASKLTVLVFYGPTCGHCKEKVPLLIPLWEKYKDKGLKIVAVGSDATDADWRKFITEHAKPEWVHFYETETSAHPSNSYYAENPTFILIDGQGKVVSRIWDLDFVIEEIEKRLK